MALLTDGEPAILVSINRALLTQGETYPRVYHPRVYKHGPPDGGRTHHQRSIDLAKRSNASVALLGHVYGRLGKRNEAMSLIKELEERHAKELADGRDIAVVYAGINDKDQAFAWLEKSFQYHSFFLSGLRLEPLLDSLHSDPRWNDLMLRVTGT